MVVNQCSARGWYLETVVMVDSSSNCTEVTFVFPSNGLMKGDRSVYHVMFPTPLTTLLCLLTF